MKHLVVYLSSALILLADCLVAQIPIEVKKHHLYVDVSFSLKGKSYTVPAIIDTGASYCVIDSTFAVDSCGFPPYECSTLTQVPESAKVQVHKTTLQKIYLASSVYQDVPCFIANLVGMAPGEVPPFIIGGDILKRELWQFDLKNRILTATSELPKQQAYTLKWHNRENFLNGIVFKGEVGGKNCRFFFDTGSRRNYLPKSFILTNPQTKEIETAHLGKPLRKESFVFYSQQMGKVGKYPFTSDFFVSKTDDFARLNADIFFGHIFILDYKAKRLIVLE